MFINTNSKNQIFLIKLFMFYQREASLVKAQSAGNRCGWFCYEFVPCWLITSLSSILYLPKETNELENIMSSKERREKSQVNNKAKMGSSETIRKLSVQEKDWLAGVLDGDGNFDIRLMDNKRRALKQIRITQHPRDARVLYRVKELLGGSVKVKGGKYLLWSISKKASMINCLNQINGRMRLKIPGFKEACALMNIAYIKADTTIPENSAYLAGLVDTDGSIVLNFKANRIDLSLEFQQNSYSETLDLTKVIPGTQPNVLKLIKRNQNKEKIFYSIRFSYQTVEGMSYVYNYFKLNRLYNDFKFYRAMQIKRFIELRALNNSPRDSPEYKIYWEFLRSFHTHLNEGKPLPSYIESPVFLNKKGE